MKIEEQEVNYQPRHKNTKRWCKGVEKREHHYEWRPARGILGDEHIFNNRQGIRRYETEVCSICGKLRKWRTVMWSGVVKNW